MAGDVTTRQAGAAAWRVADALFLVLFLFSAAVQFNDPDPLAWATIYALAGVVCTLSLTRRLRPWMPVVIGIVALLWAINIAPRVVGKVPFLEMFGAFEMKDLGVEESREMYGLLLVTAWMVVLLARSSRSSPSRRSVND